MNYRKIFIFYFIAILSFIVTTFFYAPRPRLNGFSTNFDKNDEIYVKEVYLNKGKISNAIKRKINVGNSYMVVINDEITFNITHLAFWDKKNLNLSHYAKYLPDLLIDTNEFRVVNKNNYGIKNTASSKIYQACLFNSKKASFLYKSNTDVNRYNDFNHWRWIIKKDILALISNIHQRNFNCLLITTNNFNIFENDKKNLLKIISNNFNYE